MATQAWCREKKVKKYTWFTGLFLCIFFKTLDIFSNIVFWLLHRNKKKIPLPGINNPILLESATRLAKRIRTQEVKLVLFVRYKLLNELKDEF